MKNFEKYEKEIKGAIKSRRILTICGELSNKNIEDEYEVLKWLYEEYEEPLLTDEEKEYLKVVIKPYREYVTKLAFYTNKLLIKTSLGDIAIPIYSDKAINGKLYSLEELGL